MDRLIFNVEERMEKQTRQVRLEESNIILNSVYLCQYVCMQSVCLMGGDLALSLGGPKFISLGFCKLNFRTTFFRKNSFPTQNFKISGDFVF